MASLSIRKGKYYANYKVNGKSVQRCTGIEVKMPGFTHWQQDVLRHTFATHHLATFRSYSELQLEMGHRSIELLRTRYVAMEGLVRRRYRRGESILVG